MPRAKASQWVRCRKVMCPALLPPNSRGSVPLPRGPPRRLGPPGAWPCPQAFAYVDVDGDGVISPEEFQAALLSLNCFVAPQLSLDDIRAIVSFVDRNDDGMIQWQEFVTVSAPAAACGTCPLHPPPPSPSVPCLFIPRPPQGHTMALPSPGLS